MYSVIAAMILALGIVLCCTTRPVETHDEFVISCLTTGGAINAKFPCDGAE